MKRNNLFGIIAFAAIIGFLMTGCSMGGDESSGNRSVNTARYETVPYSEITKNTGYDVQLAAYDDNYYYYVLYLGYVKRVPILFRDATLWNGTPSSGLTVGFSREEATETMVSNSITTACSETVSKSFEANWVLTV